MHKEKFKKLFTTLLFITLASTSMHAASGKCGKNVSWNLSNDGILLISGSGSMDNFGSEQPYRPDFVKRIMIGDGVTSIGNNAFRGCKNLLDISISNTVTSIGENAFKGCKQLSYIHIPNSVIEIKHNAFRDCKKINKLIIPSSVETIGKNAFNGCSSLVEVTLPNSITSLGKDAFKNCKMLTISKELPSFVTINSCSHYGFSASLVTEYLLNKENINNSVQKKGQTEIITTNTETHYISDIDAFIPKSNKVNPNTFAIIIANENYQKMSKVKYSLNDGKSFREYCHLTLGIPNENIRMYQDATYGRMIEAITDIRSIANVYQGNINIIFYYCGHGAPDEKSRESYLLPTDAYKVSSNVCISLNTLYSELEALNVENVTIFLDACFSGATRDDSMLVSARGTAIKPKENVLHGNLISFSASSGSETALQYEDKQHGMFTYYLLKKLQETNGDVTMGELCDYVTQQVLERSIIINKKKQTPTINVSSDKKNKWRNKKML